MAGLVVTVSYTHFIYPVLLWCTTVIDKSKTSLVVSSIVTLDPSPSNAVLTLPNAVIYLHFNYVTLLQNSQEE